LNGEHKQAIAYCEQALTLLRRVDDRTAEAGTWDSLGYAHHQLGQYRQAIESFERALQLFRDVADRYNEAEILTHLGDAHHAARDASNARAAWRHARDILVDLGHEHAGHLQAKLDDLDNLSAQDPLR
jgi:tetratricopeptide (TPR) repeat protein